MAASPCKELRSKADAYLRGKQLRFSEVDEVWKKLKSCDDLSGARSVLARMRQGHGLIEGELPADADLRRELCQQEALLTSKDSELPAWSRHDDALKILRNGIGNLDDPRLDADPETLGIAGGILKRRWDDLGNTDDLRRACQFYRRAAGPELGLDAYPHINAAFLNDVLASAGDRPSERRADATALRRRIVNDLKPLESADKPSKVWFNAASRAEAHFGLGEYAAATAIIKACAAKPAPWELQTTARQLAALAHLIEPEPWRTLGIRDFFEALLPGASSAPRSVVVGKVGLALSGGGFRASLYHLGVLARLAELNVLKHVDVLSCVSGGSVVGTCYWLALRRRMLQPGSLSHQDYITLIKDLIQKFTVGVQGNLRGAVQPTLLSVLRNFLFRNANGALDPEQTARAIDGEFIKPLMNGATSRSMHDLEFTPSDHDPVLTHSERFHPGRHNWLRDNKVPVLVLNATTVNTGHGWQFTPTWMGESPWAIHEAADSISRLEWAWYSKEAGWQIDVAKAVAASACVPGVFKPLEIKDAYEGMEVQLVDGGVHDNQGSVALLALNCNVVMVSDACGQLLVENRTTPGVMGLLGYANRSMAMLMERVRLATFADLTARARSGLLRGLMFQHMKAGLDPGTVRLKFSQQSYKPPGDPLTPAGIRRDFQRRLSELRTDLDVFSPDESNALMACGYQMTRWAFERDLQKLKGLADPPIDASWVFEPMLAEITSTADATPRREALLKRFEAGSATKL